VSALKRSVNCCRPDVALKHKGFPAEGSRFINDTSYFQLLPILLFQALSCARSRAGSALTPPTFGHLALVPRESMDRPIDYDVSRPSEVLERAISSAGHSTCELRRIPARQRYSSAARQASL